VLEGRGNSRRALGGIGVDVRLSTKSTEGGLARRIAFLQAHLVRSWRERRIDLSIREPVDRWLLVAGLVLCGLCAIGILLVGYGTHSPGDAMAAPARPFRAPYPGAITILALASVGVAAMMITGAARRLPGRAARLTIAAVGGAQLCFLALTGLSAIAIGLALTKLPPSLVHPMGVPGQLRADAA
jgi:hypothetical protein